MSNSNTKEFEIPLNVRSDYYAIKIPSEKGRTKIIVITHINDNEDKSLDDGESIVITRGDNKFLVEPKNIYCYGDINFASGSEDMEVINDMNWFSSCIELGISLPGNYNYEKHCCYSSTKKPTYYDTMSPAKVAQYAHAFIGKPSKTLIFRLIE